MIDITRKKVSMLFNKNRDGESFDQFKSDFYFNLRSYGEHEDKTFDEFLLALYNLDDEDYKLAYHEFVNIYYSFLRSNVGLITKLIKNNRIGYINVAQEVYKCYISVLKKYLPARNDYSTENSQTESIAILNNLLNECNQGKSSVEESIIEEFDKRCGEIEDNYIQEYHDYLVSIVHSSFIELIEREIDKINSYVEKIINSRKYNNFTFNNNSYYTINKAPNKRRS